MWLVTNLIQNIRFLWNQAKKSAEINQHRINKEASQVETTNLDKKKNTLRMLTLLSSCPWTIVLSICKTMKVISLFHTSDMWK